MSQIKQAVHLQNVRAQAAGEVDILMYCLVIAKTPLTQQTAAIRRIMQALRA